MTASTNPWVPEQLLAPLTEIAATGTYPEPRVTAEVKAQAQRVREVDPERLYALLTPAICSKVPYVVLQWLRDTGLLVHILPELDATVAFSQESDRKHKDVWEHTKCVVWQAVPRPVVRWAAVLHDIGKVPTRKFTRDGKVTFHGHAEEGVRMFRRGVAKRVHFPHDVGHTVEMLILHHLRPGQYDGSWSDSAIRRFHRETEPFLRDLLDLSRADITSRRPGKRRRCLFMISELSRRITDLDEQDRRPKILPPGLGDLLMRGLDLPAGRHIGQLRQALEALVEAGELEGGRDGDFYVQQVRERRLLDGLSIQTAPHRGRATPQT